MSYYSESDSHLRKKLNVKDTYQIMVLGKN